MAILVTIKVVPQSGKQLFKIDKNGMLKCYLKSPPEQGKANDELIKFLADKLSLPKDSIHLVRGHTLRIKTLQISAITSETLFFEKLGIEKQTKIGEKS